jgi:antitoxin (DNA-binding transcriptional repressor) of toxin-antitoxin stability system
MVHVDIEDAASCLSELFDRVAQGEEIAISRNGKAIMDLVARLPSRRAAFYGAWKGQVDMSRFDEADEEIAREFGMLD